MTRQSCCVAIFAALFSVLSCVSVAVSNEESALTHYYMRPNPRAIPDLIGKLDSVASPMSDSADWPLAMFLAEIFAKHPDVANELRKRRDAHSVRGRYTIALAACQAQLPGYKAFAC